ncbi:MAG TPA: uracil-DNA glycosylase [Pyrinomonadaceae bacterium]|jgi:uracil-DNA glycosylase family 4|nr:uracil-DNA glycosylase [Pyrinomonadaceae bacterium]
MSLFNTKRASATAVADNPGRLLFERLTRETAACRLCPAMCERTAVLSERNGPLNARVMFIGEAPGRQGGDRTRIPFSGDASGRNLQRYIDSIGLERDAIFFTNAALCNPRTPSGANRTPTRTEVHNCSNFLRRQIELIDPRVIVTLGAVSLAALKSIEYHELTLKAAAGKIFKWSGRLLVPLYHPSPQVLASHRREAEQLRDYKTLLRALRRAGLSEKQGSGVGSRSDAPD